MTDTFAFARVSAFAALCAVAHWLVPVPASAQVSDRIQLSLDASEVEAVLTIVARRHAGERIGEPDWQRLFDSQPYRRLKRREADVQRSFTDETFQQFVLSDHLQARAPDLRRTLDEWRSRDLQASARRVLRYLPPDARIHATVYPVIKPHTNSFVYDVRGDPAIFLFLDPEQSSAKFENTVAHELHHIGFASMAPQSDSIDTHLSGSVRVAVEWMSAFGEGFAMLAAAGGPDTHPHAVSPAEERARWDREMANFNQHLRELERFFVDVIEGRLGTQEEIRQGGLSFFGIQGPWYTVGYRMAVMVERRYGRETLIACMVDPPQLLARYNTAAAELNSKRRERLALWSPILLQQVGVSR
jgi:hypothetical protein